MDTDTATLVYWVDTDAYGDEALWSGRSRDDEQCDYVIYRSQVPAVVWEATLAQLVTIPPDTDGVVWNFDHGGLIPAIRYYRQHAKGRTPGLRESREAVERILAEAAKAGVS